MVVGRAEVEGARGGVAMDTVVLGRAVKTAEVGMGRAVAERVMEVARAVMARAVEVARAVVGVVRAAVVMEVVVEVATVVGVVVEVATVVGVATARERNDVVRKKGVATPEARVKVARGQVGAAMEEARMANNGVSVSRSRVV